MYNEWKGLRVATLPCLLNKQSLSRRLAGSTPALSACTTTKCGHTCYQHNTANVCQIKYCNCVKFEHEHEYDDDDERDRYGRETYYDNDV